MNNLQSLMLNKANPPETSSFWHSSPRRREWPLKNSWTTMKLDTLPSSLPPLVLSSPPVTCLSPTLETLPSRVNLLLLLTLSMMLSPSSSLLPERTTTYLFYTWKNILYTLNQLLFFWLIQELLGCRHCHPRHCCRWERIH